MPVTLEALNNPSEQDLIDLQKVYKDYPLDVDWPTLQELVNKDDNCTLYAIRFNDRLLGAMTITDAGDNLKLEHLCVRELTRQRHVGRDLLRLYKDELTNNSNTKPVVFSSCIQHIAIDTLFTQAGFTASGENNQTYIYNG